MSESYRYLFGPVPSRRLGRSLGIDVTPFKTCSFDCIFCQCGCTTRLITERAEFVPLAEVCAEVVRWLREDGSADCITFAGSGEPTLYARLGELITFIKAHTAIPVIVLSNGTLLNQPAVRAELLHADRVKISLSAWDDASFQQINRPAPGLRFEQLLAGERAFRRDFSGELWLEVFLMEGINAAPEQVEKIAQAAKIIAPDRIHLNTAVRPPAEKNISPVSKEKLEAFCAFFTPHGDVIASFSAEPAPPAQLTIEKILDLIRRHPATATQLADGFRVTVEEILQHLNDPRVCTDEREGDLFFRCR